MPIQRDVLKAAEGVEGVEGTLEAAEAAELAVIIYTNLLHPVGRCFVHMPRVKINP